MYSQWLQTPIGLARCATGNASGWQEPIERRVEVSPQQVLKRWTRRAMHTSSGHGLMTFIATGTTGTPRPKQYFSKRISATSAYVPHVY